MKNNRKSKYTSEMGYNPNTGLNKDIFVKIETENAMDREMAKRARTNQADYNILEERLMKVLNLTCKIGKGKFDGIEDLEYYKEYAILKAIETYNEEVKESLNLYVNTWFMAFINKQVTEESEKVLVR